MTALGMRIKALREEKGMRQEDIASLFGFGKSTVSLWESGKNEPDYEVVVKLAEYFGVTTDYLLGRDPDITIEIRDPESIKNMSDAENLLNDAKEALAEAVRLGHITQDKADEAADLARKQLMLFLESKK